MVWQCWWNPGTVLWISLAVSTQRDEWHKLFQEAFHWAVLPWSSCMEKSSTGGINCPEADIQVTVVTNEPRSVHDNLWTWHLPFTSIIFLPTCWTMVRPVLSMLNVFVVLCQIFSISFQNWEELKNILVHISPNSVHKKKLWFFFSNSSG